MGKKFSLNEISQILKLSQKQIKYIEKTFDITSEDQNCAADTYNESTLNKLKVIKYYLFDEMYTIAGVKKKLSQNQKIIEFKSEVIEELTQILKLL